MSGRQQTSKSTYSYGSACEPGEGRDFVSFAAVSMSRRAGGNEGVNSVSAMKTLKQGIW